MVLRQLPPSAVHVPRRREVTYEDAVNISNERWIREYEEDGVSIHEVLGGHVYINRFTQSNRLKMIVDLIFTFFDKERENWTRWKHRYSRMEKNFAKNLYNAIIAIKMNIDWHNKGAKPPVDRIIFTN